jgi:predicted aconitase
MTYWPTIGQHCSWFESSQIPYCNAVLGARTNFDGCFATCFLGKAPNYGLHITENRYGTILITTDRLIQTDMEWDVFGYAVGCEARCSVPVLTGTAKPTTTQFQKLNSAIHTGGAVEMYHIPGSTPEAPTLEFAFGGKKPEREVLIGERELRAAYDYLNYHSTDIVDMVYLGCPHLNIVDLMKLAHKLEGKKVKIPVWIMTAPWLYNVAKEQGYVKIFAEAGATLFSGACLAAMGAVPEGVKCIAVDTAKQANYVTGCYPEADKKLDVCYGTTDECIDAALTGRWRGEWRYGKGKNPNLRTNGVSRKSDCRGSCFPNAASGLYECQSRQGLHHGAQPSAVRRILRGQGSGIPVSARLRRFRAVRHGTQTRCLYPHCSQPSQCSVLNACTRPCHD